MTDCIATLHAILRDPKEQALAFCGFARAWGHRVSGEAEKERGDPAPAADEALRPAGEVAKRVKCPVARRVIEKTEKNWSGK